MTKDTNDESRKPVEHHRDGNVHAAIWKNQGENGDFHTVSFERRYKDGQGNWKSAHSYSADDMLHLEKLTDKMRERVMELDREKMWAKTIQYGEQKARESGLTADDVPAAIEESRQERKTRVR